MTRTPAHIPQTTQPCRSQRAAAGASEGSPSKLSPLASTALSNARALSRRLRHLRVALALVFCVARKAAKAKRITRSSNGGQGKSATLMSAIRRHRHERGLNNRDYQKVNRATRACGHIAHPHVVSMAGHFYCREADA